MYEGDQEQARGIRARDALQAAQSPASIMGILTALLLSAVVVLVAQWARSWWWPSKADTQALADADCGMPGPKPWPIIGSMHLLAKYSVPYQGFGDLAKIYGPVYKMKLGTVHCVVVNGLHNIREVLIQKGAHFDGRPNFARYNQLFSDKDNSLAFCDWSAKHKGRRDMLRSHTFPRPSAPRWSTLDSALTAELADFSTNLGAASASGKPVALKPLLVHACASTFMGYFCGRRFPKGHPKFEQMMFNFDKVFYEVNQGYAADFLPWLNPLHTRHLEQLNQWSHQIRDFITSEIIADRTPGVVGGEMTDYVDDLLANVYSGSDNSLDIESALYALEDIIGGHSAVANFLMKVIALLVRRPDIQNRVREEAATVAPGTIPIPSKVPYTEAVLLEGLRMISSPIVPHVANQDSSIAGYQVAEGSLIFLNNYELNMNPELWSDPDNFRPERFLSANGEVRQPEYFIPFGGGRRSCMGYKMVTVVGIAVISAMFSDFEVGPAPDVDYTVAPGSLALPWDTYSFAVNRR